MSEVPLNHIQPTDSELDFTEEFEWIRFQRDRPYHGATITVGTAEFATITREEATLPEPDTREYRAFKRWQKGGLTQRVLDIFQRTE